MKYVFNLSFIFCFIIKVKIFRDFISHLLLLLHYCLKNFLHHIIHILFIFITLSSYKNLEGKRIGSQLFIFLPQCAIFLLSANSQSHSYCINLFFFCWKPTHSPIRTASISDYYRVAPHYNL